MDGSAPCGRFLVVDDSLREAGLELETRINGERLQHAHTDAMIFPVARLVAFVSTWSTLEPGDIIATGTSEGVGMHRDPPRYLRDGDTVEIRVGWEVLRNPVVRVRREG
jgi:2-keto-4-pentenoate hydratase/2-oxohepta-3-ene-1,7-dioic acid hydratase in catechol pathway